MAVEWCPSVSARGRTSCGPVEGERRVDSVSIKFHFVVGRSITFYFVVSKSITFHFVVGKSIAYA